MIELFDDVTAKEIDSQNTTKYGIEPLMLQESAARLIFHRLNNREDKWKKFTVLVGKGNNGADGIALARMMFIANFKVSIFYFSKEEGTAEYEKQKQIAQALAIPVTKKLDADLFIDALIGVGLNGVLRSEMKNFIDRVNALDKPVYSIDCPSGLGFNAPFVAAIKASTTFVLGVGKLSLYLMDNRRWCGKIRILKTLFAGPLPPSDVTLIGNEEYDLPQIEFWEYKKTRGDLIIVGGCKEYPSTILLSAKTAFAAGIGLVTCYTDFEVVQLLARAEPSLMLRRFSDFKENEKAVLLIGPGLGSRNAEEILPFLKLSNKKVIDADGIRTYARYYKEGKIGKLENAILTPHLGELKVLIEAVLPGKVYKTPKEYLQLLIDLSYTINAELIVKSEVCVIVKEGFVQIVDLVNPSLAVAGSGDVLASLIATLWVKCEFPGAAGALLHKRAGRISKKAFGYYSCETLIKVIGKIR